MINIQITNDNECFKWCLLRYLNHADQNPKRITKADKDFGKRLDFEYTKFPVKIRDIHKLGKRIPLALAFLVMEIRKNVQSMYFEKKVENIFVVIVYMLSLQKKF